MPAADPAHAPILQRLLGALSSTFAGSRRGVRDVSFSLAAQGVASAAGIVTSVLIARGLQPTRLGEYALILSVTTFVASASDAGVAQTAIRYGARLAKRSLRGTRWVIGWATRRRLAMVALLGACAAAAAPFLVRHAWNAAHLDRWLQFALLIPAALALGANVPAYLQARGRFGLTALVGILQSGSSLACIAALAFFGEWSLGRVLAATLVATAAAALLSQRLVPASVRIWDARRLRPAAPPPPLAREVLDIRAFARAMIPTTLVAQVVLNADVWILATLVERQDLGHYSAATRFGLPLSMAVAAVTQALWPRFSRTEDARATLVMLRRVLRLAALAAVGLAAYAALAPLLAPWLFGDSYRPAVALGQLLCARYVAGLFANVLMTAGYSLGWVRIFPFLHLARLAVLAIVAYAAAEALGAAAVALGLVCMELAGAAVLALAIAIAARARRR